jgi:hypothetical protein
MQSFGGIFMVNCTAFLHINGLFNHLNTSPFVHDYEDAGRRMVAKASPFQGIVHSMHADPFIAIVEKRSAPIK